MKEEIQNYNDTAALAAEMASLFADSPELKAADMVALRRAAVELESDPQFQADYIKGRFVSVILSAMEDLHVTQTSLAASWGKTRQYLNKILNEDRRVNFTVETMVQLAMLVNLKVRIDFDEIHSSETIISSVLHPMDRNAPFGTLKLPHLPNQNEYRNRAEFFIPSSREHDRDLAQDGVELTA